MSQRLLTITSQELRSHLAQTQAIAVILLAGGRVQTVAGGLSPLGFQAATQALYRYWPDAGRQDPSRWVGLWLEEQFYLLIARLLPDGMGLVGLIFPATTPLACLRQDLAAVLQAIQEKEESSLSKPFMERNLQNPEKNSRSPERPVENNKAAYQEEVGPLAAERHGHSPEKIPAKPAQNDWEHLSSEAIEGGIIQGATWQPLAEIVHHEEDLVSILQEDFDASGKKATGRDWPVASNSASYPNSTAVLPQVDTQPVRINPALENWTVGVAIPVATAISFYLAPRQTKHFLIGGLSRQLRIWMPELCETYGWELDLLSVRPDYLKWTLRDFPESLTRDMLQTIREKTSLRIFRVFPNLKEGADSSDFWAPGYLVDNQNRDFTTQALMARVAQDRLGGNS